jgi:hypothetical protein
MSFLMERACQCGLEMALGKGRAAAGSQVRRGWGGWGGVGGGGRGGVLDKPRETTQSIQWHLFPRV